MATDVLKRRGTLKNSRKGSWTKLSIFLLQNGTELLERFLRNCNPTLTHVNSKSLIIKVSDLVWFGSVFVFTADVFVTDY